MLLNNDWVTNEMKEEIKNVLETNDNKNKATKNLWNTMKAVLRRKFIATSKKMVVNPVTQQLKELQREQQEKPIVSRRKGIIKIRPEISDIETKKFKNI